MSAMLARIATLLLTLVFACGGDARAAGDPPGQTRFGRLSVAYGGPLLLDDKPLQPEIRGNESLDILNVFRIGASDVALIQDNGGSGCPAQMMFVTLNKSGVSTSSEFGTCATLVRARRSGDAIVVTMPLLYGHGTRRYLIPHHFPVAHAMSYVTGSLVYSPRGAPYVQQPDSLSARHVVSGVHCSIWD